MTDTKSALRMFLATESGHAEKDFTVFLGESIELAMIVYGLASTGALEAANGNSAPRPTGAPVSHAGIRKAT